jgi:hypothetical protein
VIKGRLIALERLVMTARASLESGVLIVLKAMETCMDAFNTQFLSSAIVEGLLTASTERSIDISYPTVLADAGAILLSSSGTNVFLPQKIF